MELSEAESSWMQHRLSGRSENHKFIWVCGLFVCLGGCMHAKYASVMSIPLRPYGLQPTRLLTPRDGPGKSTAVGCHAFLQSGSS